MNGMERAVTEAATDPAADPDDAVLSADHGPVRVLTLNRPERRNALNREDRLALLTALDGAEADPSCRAVVLTGAGGVFSAGGDIRSMSPDPETSRDRLALVNRLARTLVTMPTPVVAAVEGGAWGLGLALACASDLVVADRSSRFAASFAKIGLAPDTGLTWSLPRRVGAGRARGLLLTARSVETDEAERIGLVDEVVDDGSAVSRARALAEELAGFSAPATAALKRLLARCDAPLDEVLDAEAEEQERLLAGEDFTEGRAAFFERRPARFSEPARPSTRRCAGPA